MIRSLTLIGMMAGLLLARRRAGIEQKDADSSIEVGASDDELRLWKAREAVRQAELRLAAQAAIRTGLEARATALTGWGAVGLLATAAALFASLKEGNAPGTFGAAAAAIGLLIAGGMGIYAARPRGWDSVGYEPSEILDDPWPSELQTLESIAGGLGNSISRNQTRLKATGRSLRIVGVLLVVAPIAGGIGYGSAAGWITVLWGALVHWLSETWSA